MNVTQYHEIFFHLVKYVPQYQHDELFRTQKFVMGLRPEIYSEVEMQEPETMEFALRKALKQEQRLKDASSYKSSNPNYKREF